MPLIKFRLRVLGIREETARRRRHWIQKNVLNLDCYARELVRIECRRLIEQMDELDAQDDDEAMQQAFDARP
jgi:hypothetical protein